MPPCGCRDGSIFEKVRDDGMVICQYCGNVREREPNDIFWKSSGSYYADLRPGADHTVHKVERWD